MSNTLSNPDQSHADEVAELVAGAKVGMVTTCDEQGDLLSRPMAAVERS